MITIFDALFIIAIDDQEGDLLESVVEPLEHCLAGAVLAELLLRHRIEIRDGRVSVTDPTSTGNPVLDQNLYAILDSSRLRKIKYWVNTMTYEKLCSEIAHHLVDKGVLARKKKHLHLVIPFDEKYGATATEKFIVKNRLREIVLAGQPPTPEEWIQLVLLYYCDLLTLVFTRGERKAAAKRIAKLIDANEIDSGICTGLDEIIAVAKRSLV